MKKTSLIHERQKTKTSPINIPTTKNLGNISQLELSTFNPPNSTPPNVFIETLNKRMNLYYHTLNKN